MMEYQAIKCEDFKPEEGLEKWRKANIALLCENEKGGTPRYRTHFQAMHSLRYLYFKFTVEDEKIVASYTKFNEPLYDEEVVEVFVSGKGSLERYLELEVNPNNAVFCANIDNDLKGTTKINFIKPNPIESQVKMTENGWECVIKIEKRSIEAFDEKKLLFNAYRIDRDEGMELYAFSPTMCNRFHVPQKFAKLILM